MNHPIIAVGALGGSGTRVVARILSGAGIHLGDDVNGAGDNLIFTRLFRDPEWYLTATPEQVKLRVGLFKKYMTANNLSFKERWQITKASFENKGFRSKGSYYYRIIKDHRHAAQKGQQWGWKEPNTAIIVNDLFKYIEDLKYVHVIRHGLDMAFSRKTKQLKNWGSLFNLNYTEDLPPDLLAAMQFDYWAQLNERVIQFGKYHAPGRLFVLDHGALCERPVEVVQDLLDFCEVTVDEATMNELISLPQVPDSTGRFRSNDLNFMNEERWAKLRALGYDTN